MDGQTARSVIFTWKACERISQMPTMTRIPCLPLAAENVSLSRAILHNSWIFRCTLCTRGIWIIRIPPVDHHPMEDARRSTLLFQSRRGQSVWLARDHQASYWNRSLHCMNRYSWLPTPEWIICASADDRFRWMLDFPKAGEEVVDTWWILKCRGRSNCL